MEKKNRGVIPRKIKGFRDIDQGMNQLRWHIISRAAEVYRRYGFEHWDTPILEYADTLGKYLPESGTVADGVYSFSNPEKEPVLAEDGKELRDENDKVIMENHFLTMRYDQTAPLARLYSERIWNDVQKDVINANNAPLMRRYQYGPVFRFEQKLDPGRFREFWQLDFDTVGTRDVAADAEAVMILSDAMEAIGLRSGSFIVKVNNRKLLSGLLIDLGLTSASDEQNILRIIDKADKIGMDGVQAELGKGRKDDSGAFIEGLGLDPVLVNKIITFFGTFENRQNRSEVILSLKEKDINNETYSEGLDELTKIDSILDSVGFDDSKVVFDPTLVRGMAYYTGPIFEVESLDFYRDRKGRKRKVGSICGGGRYDGLVKNLTGIEVPAVGASIGVDRLAELLTLTQQTPEPEKGPVVVIVFDDELMDEYQRIAGELRKAGIPAEVYYGQKKGLKKQFQYADRKNSPFAIMLGSDELEKKVATVKDLFLGKMQTDIKDKNEWRKNVQKEVPLSGLVQYIKERF
jgi:histidyl-tRNA synthetase